jgi:4-hydroxy-4-methyl-2-oxoglutarate aldolase
MMSSGARTKGAAATAINGTMRDLAAVRKLDYRLFTRSTRPVGVLGRMKAPYYQTELNVDGVRIRPDNVIIAAVTGVVILPHDLVVVIADATDEFGKIEVASRQRVLASEDLQKIWPVARLADRSASHSMKCSNRRGRR